MTPSERRRVPVWFTVIVTIIALPALLLPTFIALAEDEMAESKKNIYVAVSVLSHCRSLSGLAMLRPANSHVVDSARPDVHDRLRDDPVNKHVNLTQ